eukprot:TRINITY_DN34116_c0_g1_i1.p1 TRINITY_DN34116_c0_g1~~TRINITY_DN34116_c0_g1_i1.p1  ORF type:complete len:769 (+),score=163.83 TRINITY_DN34116_c0_g1_i1:39-2345(+)
MSQPRILCLHGTHQDAEIFSQRLQQLKKKLADVELLFVDAPVAMAKQEGEDVAMRTWWEDGDASGMAAAVLHVKSLREASTCVGVLGFSQGAALTAALLKDAGLPDIKFGILAGGMVTDSEWSGRCAKQGSDVPTLHFAGKTDTLVPLEASKRLAGKFNNSVFIEHDAGHIVPQGVVCVDAIMSFLRSNLPQVALNEDVAEEIQGLCDVFQEEVEWKEGEPIFSHVHTIEDGKLQGCKIRTTMQLTRSYPEEPPIFTYEEVKGTPGWLVKAIWYARFRDSVQEEAEMNAGCPMLYTLVEKVKEAIGEISCEQDSKEAAGEVNLGVEAETEEEKHENARNATEAIQSMNLTEDDWADAWGKGGRWKYVIGLVGKPSAGKSTLFNAATGDATAARVAAFPFTTIEPNTGDALCPIPCICQKADVECAAEHGHAADGSRFVPVKVRDVAGLVPGAYQGRGKGNKFLDDLNDADVLIHVVDASGLTNSEGESKEKSNSDDVLEEVRWVRREIHQWIYTNVSRKWVALKKKPQRLPIMFTGYHATENMVRLAAKKAGITSLEMETLHSWGPLKLHLLVAAFIRIRFPVVVAMNKCDLPSAKENVQFVRSQLPNEAIMELSADIETQMLKLRDAGELVYKVGSVPEGELPPHVREYLESHDGTTGVTKVMSTSITLRPATRVFPVCDPSTLGSYGGKPLYHSFHLTPGSTALDLFKVMSNSGLLEGDFVRSALVSLEDRSSQIIKKTDPLPQDCTPHIMTNRKSKWQQKDKPSI